MAVTSNQPSTGSRSGPAGERTGTDRQLVLVRAFFSLVWFGGVVFVGLVGFVGFVFCCEGELGGVEPDDDLRTISRM